jgi:hypothetical protein
VRQLVFVSASIGRSFADAHDGVEEQLRPTPQRVDEDRADADQERPYRSRNLRPPASPGDRIQMASGPIQRIAPLRRLAQRLSPDSRSRVTSFSKPTPRRLTVGSGRHNRSYRRGG